MIFRNCVRRLSVCLEIRCEVDTGMLGRVDSAAENDAG